MQTTINRLNALYPALNFKAGKQFYWSPETAEIFYNEAANDDQAQWSLLHETGHALLQHTSYTADVELLRLEVAAWGKARELAELLDIKLDEDHIQDCLDTYRDWLYKRSICPKCHTKCLQQDNRVNYRCFNCHAVWQVSSSRFCRAYRTIKNVSAAPIFTLRNTL
jgi:hypothetical protein